MTNFIIDIINELKLNENTSYFPTNFNKNSASFQCYTLSSFSYLLIAILQLTVFKNTIPVLKNILFIQSICLIIQSICTYYADVINVGKQSNWHIYDRIVATFNTIFI